MIYQYYADQGGNRFVVQFHEGRKWIKLLDTGTLDVYKISLREGKKLKPYTKIKPKTLAKRLRKRRALRKKLEMSFPKKAVESAIKKLET